MLLMWMLLASVAALVSGDDIDVFTNQSGGAVHIYNSSGDGRQSFSQWFIGNLMCFISRIYTTNGDVQYVKQCKRGNLGDIHPMTPEEEEIIRAQIIKTEEEKRIMKHRMEENQLMLQNTVRSMQKQMQSNMRRMQETMQNAFKMLG